MGACINERENAMSQTCKHYKSSYHNEECDAGVRYEDVTPDPTILLGRYYRLPCHSRTEEEINELNPIQRANYSCRGTCNLFELPTAEGVASEEQEMIDALSRLAQAAPLCQKLKEQNITRPAFGVEECPICQNRLDYSIGVNNHMMMRCETSGCINFIE